MGVLAPKKKNKKKKPPHVMIAPPIARPQAPKTPQPAEKEREKKIPPPPQHKNRDIINKKNWKKRSRTATSTHKKNKNNKNKKNQIEILHPNFRVSCLWGPGFFNYYLNPPRSRSGFSSSSFSISNNYPNNLGHYFYFPAWYVCNYYIYIA